MAALYKPAEGSEFVQKTDKHSKGGPRDPPRRTTRPRHLRAINFDAALEAFFETGDADELLLASALVDLPLRPSPVGAMRGGRVHPERRYATSRIRLQNLEAHRH
jgi:hypothetical protein